MPKFFVETENIKENEEIWITGQDVNHIKNVLRKKVDEKLKICNSDTSTNYECIITKIDKDKIICKIIDEIKLSSESNLNVTIFQGLPKSGKMELIIQKCTELGAKTIIPMITQRSVVKLKEKDKENKHNRWQKIAEVAAKQCGRDKIPIIGNIIDMERLDFKDQDIVIALYENEENTSIKQVIENLKILKKEKINIAVVIGPEGGFNPIEIDRIKNDEKVVVATLGKRILRTETVGMVITGILMYELGDLN